MDALYMTAQMHQTLSAPINFWLHIERWISQSRREWESKQNKLEEFTNNNLTLTWEMHVYVVRS